MKKTTSFGWALAGVAAAFAACSLDERKLTGPSIDFIPWAGEGGMGYAEAGTGGSSASPSGGDSGGPPQGSGGAGGSAGGAGGAGGSASGTGGTTGGSGGSASGSGGAPRGGSGGTGGSEAGDTGVGGTAGSGIAGAPGRCPDLDRNGVLDCDETLVKNPSFDSDYQSWKSDTDMELAWESEDATGHHGSGSLASTSSIELDQEGSRMLAAEQCLPVEPAVVYHLAAQASVPDDAGDTFAGLQLVVMTGPSCTGDAVDAVTSDLVQQVAWSAIEFAYLTPTTAKSAFVRLVTVKPFRQPPVTVLFDDVLLHRD